MGAIFPIILSGGTGTRLWPLSHEKFPKQFIGFDEAQGLSLMQAACMRLPAGEGFQPPTLICNDAHRFLVRDQMDAINVAARQIILEPARRNTGPAVTIGALSVIEDDPDAILAVMPSDHIIENSGAFVGAVRQGAVVAEDGLLVLFGIVADRPDTGYGYIRRGTAIGRHTPPVYSVDAFVEKPGEEGARALLDRGNAYWNSGIFVFQARKFLDETARLNPDMLSACRRALDQSEADLGFVRLDEAAFAQNRDISVDVAIMERTQASAMLPLDAGWSDVGSWSSLLDLAKRDEDGNAVSGRAILEGTRDCYLRSTRPVLAAIGVENLIVVDTPDALLVADARHARDLPEIIGEMAANKHFDPARSGREYRPWGFYEILNSGAEFQVKLLHVKPGARLSFQMHRHRSEHWVVVSGVARVRRAEERRIVRKNESICIPVSEWHQLDNPGADPLEIIEIQLGSYLGEDDIIRGEDPQGRDINETD